MSRPSAGSVDSPRWLVCFDLGGVLVDITTWAQASHDAGMKHRVPLAADDVQRELVARLDLGAIDFESWAQAMADASLGAYSAEEVKRVHHALSRKEHPGAWALVTELHNLGIATACLSNTNFAHWMRLVHRDGDRPREGLPEYPAVSVLRHRFASHVLGMAKPNAAIYEHVELATGARPHEIYFFDDRPENVEAAVQRGWRANRVHPRYDPVGEIRKHLIEAGILR